MWADNVRLHALPSSRVPRAAAVKLKWGASQALGGLWLEERKALPTPSKNGAQGSRMHACMPAYLHGR